MRRDLRTLKGKVVVLTGASSGIGRATAVELGHKGAILYLVARREPLLEEVCNEVRELGGTATACPFDVRDTRQMADLAERLRAQHGGVDVLINNAGVGVTKSFLDTTDDDWAWALDINLRATIDTIRVFLPLMLDRGRGTIVNVASMAGVVGNGLSAYTASKFAVVGLSESLLIQYGDRGVDIIVVCPGAIKTDIAAAALAAGKSDEAMGSSLQDFLSKYGAAPEVAARDIVEAIQNPRFLVRTPTHATVMHMFHQLFPGLTRVLLRRMNSDFSAG